MIDSSVWVYVVLTIVTVGFAVFIKNSSYVPFYIKGRIPVGWERQQAVNFFAEAAIYGLLAGVSACRIAVGNDYWGYAANFRLIAQGRHVSSEFGFNFVVKWMQELFGYNQYLPIFGLFSLLTVYFFVRSIHDQGEWYAGSLFLLLTGGYYFSSMNSVRYYFALSIALFSIKYVLRGEYGKFILWILLAASFHKSVFVVIPSYLIAKWLSLRTLKKWHYIVGAGCAVSMIVLQDWYRRIIFWFYPYYEGSDFDTGELSIVNIAKCVAVLVLAGICWKDSMKAHTRNRFYFFLNVLGIFVYTFGSFIPEVSRIGYYMIISQIFLIPNLLLSMKKGWLRSLCIIGTAVAYSGYFVIFLYKSQDVSIRLLPYLNWIFN